LRDAVGEAFTHVVKEKIREKIRCLIGERGTRPGEEPLAIIKQGRMATGRSLSLQKCRAHYRWTVTGVGIRKIMFELPR
jgi:hypothetical protein